MGLLRKAIYQAIRKSPQLIPLLKIDPIFSMPVIRRDNRFVVVVRDENGKERRAHINNTGRLHDFIYPYSTALLTTKNPGKTDFRLVGFHDRGSGALTDTNFQMKVFGIAWQRGLIPWLADFEYAGINAPLGGNSLIDYLGRAKDGKDLYLEAKSATEHGEGTFSMYPDCPSTRGQKHIKELTERAKKGGRAGIVFFCALPGVTAFTPNDKGDPTIRPLLKEARKAGVDIHAIGMELSPDTGEILLRDTELGVGL